LRRFKLSILEGIELKQTMIFIVTVFLIFAVVTQGGLKDIGVAGFVAVLVISFLVSKFGLKLFDKKERPE
jgi:hypothetical protein